MLRETMLTGLAVLRPRLLFSWLDRMGWYGGTLRAWTDALPLPGGARVLELGSGPGALAADLARRGWRVTASDRSTAMLRAARRHPGVDLLRADAMALPPQAQGFDAILAASLVNLLPDRPGFFADMSTRLAPGGLLSVLFPTPAMRPQLADALGLRGWEAAGYRVWAAAPPKLAPETVIEEMAAAGLHPLPPVLFLNGTVAAVTVQRDT